MLPPSASPKKSKNHWKDQSHRRLPGGSLGSSVLAWLAINLTTHTFFFFWGGGGRFTEMLDGSVIDRICFQVFLFVFANNISFQLVQVFSISYCMDKPKRCGRELIGKSMMNAQHVDRTKKGLRKV